MHCVLNELVVIGSRLVLGEKKWLLGKDSKVKGFPFIYLADCPGKSIFCINSSYLTLVLVACRFLGQSAVVRVGFNML